MVAPVSQYRLRLLAKTAFESVPNKHLNICYKNEVIFDQKHSFGKVFNVIPGTDIRQVSILWQMPESYSNWKAKTT